MEKGDAMIREPSDAGVWAKPAQGRRLRAEVRAHYERLLHRLPWPGPASAGGPRTLGVSSCHGGEGVSTVAMHLAVTAASLGDYRVLLIDANFAEPCVPRMFGVRGRPGLAEALQNGDELSELLQPSGVDNLSLLVGGRPVGGHSRVFGAPALEGLVKELAGEFDLVVVDLPAADQSSAALQLAARLDGILLVVEAGRAPCDAAQRVIDLLARAGAHLLGVVLNKWQENVPAWLSRTL
jgi:capsular exopolysaccharide synthesis family protein